MVLIGLWVAKKEPDMKIFLQPFVDKANELSITGFKWNYNSEDIHSYLFPLGCCVDSPARSSMLNMKKFNGSYGCTYCEHPTESVDGFRKYPMLNEPLPSRTDDSIKQKMITAAHENRKLDIMGILGPSPLMYLKHFDLVKGMVLDFMHSCLLGVTESHMTILMTNAKEDYYIGSPAKIHLINERLLSIKPPSCIARIPRNIEERNQWKASQWLSWLIYYSLICLQGILPDNKCSIYHKIILNGCRYTSCTYNQCKKTNDSVFKIRDGDFGIIKKICKLEYNNTVNVFIFVNKIRIEDTYLIENTDVCVKHIKHCTIPQTNDINIITCDDIHQPCILMNIKSQLFRCSFNKAMTAKYIH
ncbi:hypothetical protein TSAR_016628 [Trichomalopsis sarcophagae]|uniref:Uncharacterized protein n=1 Tax=Trichomalopsis sarcophagae TaxID=543379 RepID=A0A232FDN2_9HYME|nr:hypothetical protein TSAR_016628 [Trichomalopsis sarcophagae]